MKHTKNTMQYVQSVHKFTCDSCGVDIFPDTTDSEEMIRIEKTCGYGSVFSDGAVIQCDVCQHCVKAILGNILKIN